MFVNGRRRRRGPLKPRARFSSPFKTARCCLYCSNWSPRRGCLIKQPLKAANQGPLHGLRAARWDPPPHVNSDIFVFSCVLPCCFRRTDGFALSMLRQGFLTTGLPNRATCDTCRSGSPQRLARSQVGPLFFVCLVALSGCTSRRFDCSQACYHVMF